MWFFNLFLQGSKASCFHVFCLLQSRTFHFQPGTCISCHHRFISHSELIVNFPCFIFCSLFCCRHICNPVPLPSRYLNSPPPQIRTLQHIPSHQSWFVFPRCLRGSQFGNIWPAGPASCQCAQAWQDRTAVSLLLWLLRWVMWPLCRGCIQWLVEAAGQLWPCL